MRYEIYFGHAFLITSLPIKKQVGANWNTDAKYTSDANKDISITVN